MHGFLGKRIPETQLRNKQLHDKWNEKNDIVMKIALLHKARDSDDFSNVLVSTGSQTLHEMVGSPNHWNWPGEDKMGLLLMEIRLSLNHSTIHLEIEKSISTYTSTFYVPPKARDNRRKNLAARRKKKEAQKNLSPPPQ